MSLLQAKTNLSNHNDSNTPSFEQGLMDKLHIDIQKHTLSTQNEKIIM